MAYRACNPDTGGMEMGRSPGLAAGPQPSSGSARDPVSRTKRAIEQDTQWRPLDPGHTSAVNPTHMCTYTIHTYHTHIDHTRNYSDVSSLITLFKIIIFPLMKV